MTRNAEFALLKSLSELGNYAIPKKILYADVNLRMPSTMVLTHQDFEDLLNHAQEKSRIRCITGEDGVTIKITDDGKHRLAELRG